MFKSQIFTLFLMITFINVLYSCSQSDKDDEPSVIEEETSNFIGYWENETGKWDLLFLENGECIANDHNRGGNMKRGVWTFNKENNYLTNTATKETYYLTYFDEDEFMGIDIFNDKKISYTRGVWDWTRRDIVRLILAGRWISSEGDSFSYSYSSEGDNFNCKNKPKLPSDTSKTRYLSQWLNIEDSKYIIMYYVEEYDYRDRRWYKNNIESTYSGTFEVENLMNPSKCKIKFTSGIIEGTYIRE